MRTLTTAALLLSCLLVPACADDTVPLSPLRSQITPATIEFVHVYFAYAQAIRDHGVQGMKEFTTLDFVLRLEDHASRGDKAYQELGGYMNYLHGTSFTASAHPLTVSGTNAVVLTRETSKASIANTPVTNTWYWKQTWRKTAQGWKLAAIERNITKDAEDFDKARRS